jgi:DNA ligase-1
MRTFVSILLIFLAVPPSAADELRPPDLMHASTMPDTVDVSAYLVSEKLDGVRGHWTGERLLTRGGHAVRPPEWFTADWPSTPMDGELWLGRGRFAQASGVVRTRRPVDAEWREMRFMVFDLPAHAGPFEARARRIRELLQQTGVPWLRPVRQSVIADADALDARLERVVDAGGEGLMLHRRDARYRPGRSEALLKYKPWTDAEARVVAHTRGKGRYRGMLGALVVERADGLRFRLGTGFSDAQRADPPPVGSRVTYRHNGFTANGIPRFARFLRVRPRIADDDVRR